MDFTLLASLCAGAAVILISILIGGFLNVFTVKYKEKYMKEAAVEADNILLTLPPERILDMSLILAALAAFLAAGLVGFSSQELSVTKMVLGGLFAAIGVFPLPRILLRYLKKKRIRRFNEQLEDALLSMSSSLKAGFSINQALEGVAAEKRNPISFEFNLLIQELRLGVSLDEALRKMAARLECPDFDLTAVAILTARQTGGELTATLERLASVIRERIRITARIRALTAQGRMQAVIIGLMPVALFIAMLRIAPDMMNAFFSTVPGVLCLLAVIVLDVTGFLMIRKITNIDI
ncbi:MAG: type II secretion system F family protein [Lentisphaeria bacterium]|nr:type II secretion system F family protein [Lentisphaeria bacterium]